MNATATTANMMAHAAHTNRVHTTRTSRTTDTRQSRCLHLSSSHDHPSPPSLRHHPSNSSSSLRVKRSSSSSLRNKPRAPSRCQRRLTISSRKPRCSRSPHPLSSRRKSRPRTSKRRLLRSRSQRWSLRLLWPTRTRSRSRMLPVARARPTLRSILQMRQTPRTSRPVSTQKIANCLFPTCQT